MEHNSVIENHMAERYLMGELNEVDRDAYEAHYFSCAACAEEIQSASEFIESARSVLREERRAQTYAQSARPSVWAKWLNWRSLLQPVPAFACSLLVAAAAVMIYQNQVTIPRLAQMGAAQLISTEPIMLRNARAASASVVVARGKSFVLSFDIPPASYTVYQVSVLSQTGSEKLAYGAIPAQDAKNTQQVIVPPGQLQPGKYSLLIKGADKDREGEVDRIPFEITYRD